MDDPSPGSLNPGGCWRDGVHHLAVRVYYEDTDATGVVYHAGYLRFMERARSDMLRLAGIDQRDWMTRADQRYFAVRSLAIDYLQPAFLDDDLVVASRIRDVAAASFIVEQDIWRDQVQVAKAQVRGASLGAGGRPRRMPEAWRETFIRIAARAAPTPDQNG